MNRFRLLALALVGAASAQMRLDIQLSADPAQRGPPALVLARQQLVRLAADGPLSWQDSLLISLDAAGIQVRRGPDLPLSKYLIGTLTTPAGQIVLEGDASGRETWSGPTTAFAAAPVHDFLACTDVLRAHGRAAWVDVAVVVGVLGTGFETESPLGLLSTLGAAECGELIVRALAFGSYVMLEGRSRGGLALPAILVAAARRHAAPLSEEQRWIALAFAARDDRREEAALQLARFASPPSERCLLALLHGQDFAAACAFEALARRGACDALPQMAALPALAQRDPVAVAALATLWPSCSPEQRSATRAQLAGNADLLAVVDRLDRPWPAKKARAYGRLRLALGVGLSLSALWLLAALLRGRL